MLCLSVDGLSTDSIDRTRALSSTSSRKRPVFRRLLAICMRTPRGLLRLEEP